ncbi:MAG: ZIP family metal transporter [Burkholderiales bacterium]|nr:ZIP family metal transporter [Burkholderiales bacterium]
MVLASILAANLAGGLLSVFAAALLAFAVLERWVPRLVSFAVGALLGAALLNLLPEALDSGADMHAVFATLLVGLLVFFLLEKLALWRHAHGPGDDAHGHHVQGGAVHPAGGLIVLGDSLHNFVDGVLIAAAFLTDPALGWATAVAVIAHEVPQEVGDFMVLLHAGYARRRALALNALASLASVAGGLVGYFALRTALPALPYVLAFAAAGFLYIAVADLIPTLHRRFAIKDALSQVGLIATGVAIVALAGQGHGH